jgi:hypothetical protein
MIMRVVIEGRRTKHGMEDERLNIINQTLCLMLCKSILCSTICYTNVTEGGVYIVPTNHHGIN